jgi:hypothetical protein
MITLSSQTRGLVAGSSNEGVNARGVGSGRAAVWAVTNARVRVAKPDGAEKCCRS